MTDKMEPVHPGDLENLLKSAFAAGLNKSQSQLDGDDLKRWNRYVERPVPLSTHQRVEHALTRSVITDEMVERAARALEALEMQTQYGWADELFEIWWNEDPNFVTKKHVWGFFVGTFKERSLWEARIILEAAQHFVAPLSGSAISSK